MDIMGSANDEEKKRVIMKLCQTDEEMNIFLKSNLNYLKKLVKNAKRSSTGELKLKKYLRDIYHDYVDDLDFLVWLGNLAGTSSVFFVVGVSNERGGR